MELKNIAFIVSFMLVACTASPSQLVEPTVSPLQSPLTTPQSIEPVGVRLLVAPTPPVPAEGRASVAGHLYTSRGNASIPETVFYLFFMEEGRTDLPAVYKPGTERGDVRSATEADGTFVVGDIAPGTYRILVWVPYGWIEAQESQYDSVPLTLQLGSGEALQLGTVYVPWP